MAKELFRTNYATAVDWLDTQLILCNNIGEVDPSVYDNLRFNLFEEDEDGYENETEIFQWFLTDASESDVEWLEEHFGLLFTYSDLLDLYVLCVDHWGTGWDYVMIDTDIPQAARKEGERK